MSTTLNSINSTNNLLLILDGFGHRTETDSNAILAARTPNLDKLLATCPNTLISGCGVDVGLVAGQMGNSEVGHLNIGAGRIVYQQGTRITHDIETGEFFNNPTFLRLGQTALQHKSNIHILILLSPGGVHSDEAHLYALLKSLKQSLTQPTPSMIFIHAFLDGRDMPPKSAGPSIQRLEETIQTLGLSQQAKIASLCGRFFAMDRDKRWDRIEKAYNMLVNHEGHIAADAKSALENAYAKGQTDEFVEPSVLTDFRLNDNDCVMFMNFRADRARQLSHSLTSQSFSDFERKRFPKLAFFGTLTEYEPNLTQEVAYRVENLKQTLGEVISSKGLHQLRIAETEKFAHVTFFFNGGSNETYLNEDRVLIPSPKVATYDLQPKMSAIELTDALCAAMQKQKYALIVCNYANADMVGHTGNFKAAVEAIECLDECVGRIVDTLNVVGGQMLLTADHGNAEMMQDPITHQPHTAHTTELVPFLYYGPKKGKLKLGGKLSNVAPTLLHLMNIEKPKEMTGENLFEDSNL